MFNRNLLKCVLSHHLKSYPLINNHLKLLNVINNHCVTSLRTTNYLHSNILTSNNKHVVKENSDLLSEEAYLVKIKNDPDSFGLASDREPEIDPDDVKEENFLKDLPPQKKSTKQYADILKSLIKSRKIKEAIDYLEQTIIKEDRAKPENYLFNLVIGACGRVGYTKKAFSLYNQLKKRGLSVHPGTYTALFNACANSPWLTDGLTRAQHLRNIMIEKSYDPNETNYNAMIKAFGRCGDLATAFALVDEMTAKKIQIKDDTLNFLLQACVHDTDAGFRHALLVWRKFITKNIAPSIFSYNLMLRCIRDCGMGDLQVTKDVISKLVANESFLIESGSHEKQIIDNKEQSGETSQLQSSNQTPTADSVAIISSVNFPIENRPNLMAKVPHLGDVLSLSEIKRPEDRLLLVGGFSGFLKDMDMNKCKPDIKTFTQLLDALPSTAVAEHKLLTTTEKYGIKPDVDFYNTLIRKRSMRFDYESAKEVLLIMKEMELKPNLITYGVLALGCKTKEEATEFIKKMNESDYRLNIEIVGAMLHQACSHNNISYVLEMMRLCITENIKPSSKFLEHLEKFKKKLQRNSNDQRNSLSQSKYFMKEFMKFKQEYVIWLKQIEPEDNIHPWQQYREESKTDREFYKDKEAKTRFKPRHLSKFKVKTSTKVRY